MKRNFLAMGVVLGALVGWLAFDPPAPRGAGANPTLPPAERTGAPGDLLCSDACHTGNAVNDGVGLVRIDGVPASYTPTQTYALTVVVQRAGQLRWGFELTALKNSDNTMAGALGNTTEVTATQPSGGRSYISHTNLNGPDGTFSGAPSGSWTFNWVAPAAGAGTVTFYAAGNAANGTGTSLGDFIYSTTTSSMEGTSTAVDAVTWGKIKMLYR